MHLVILHYFLFLGDSEWIARFPSLIFGLLSLVVFFNLTKRLYGKISAFFSGLVLVLSPLFLEYSLYAGNYALFTFLSLLSLYYFNEFVINGNAKYSHRFAVTTVLLAWSNYLSAFVLISEGLWIILKKRSWFKNKRNIKLIAAIFVFILPIFFMVSSCVSNEIRAMGYSKISPSHFWGVEEAKGIIFHFFLNLLPDNSSSYFFFFPLVLLGIVNYSRNLKKDKFGILLLTYIAISLTSIKLLSYYARMSPERLTFLYPAFILIFDSSTRFLAGIVKKFDRELPFDLLKISFWVIIIVFYAISFRPGLEASEYHLVGAYLKEELKEPSPIVFEPHNLRTILAYYLFDDSYSFIKACLYNKELYNFTYPFYCSDGNTSMIALIERPDSESWMVEDLNKLEKIPKGYWYVETSKFENPHILDFLNKRCKLKKRFEEIRVHFCGNAID
ncbi:glycosyltransferase family 39 protein [Candidatus Woesearchaeota archaeon]|nr:glycosyltransferase family 39 protein [Candidatus Woesearchaeota archaeon]